MKKEVVICDICENRKFKFNCDICGCDLCGVCTRKVNMALSSITPVIMCKPCNEKYEKLIIVNETAKEFKILLSKWIKNSTILEELDE